MPLSHQVTDSNRSCSTTSHVRNFDGNVRVGDKFVDRRLHLHPRQLGGNSNNGKNDINGKDDKIGKDVSFFTNENRFPEPPSHFANFFTSQSIGFI